MAFGQALMVALLIVALIGGFFYWMRFFFKKVMPDFKYDFKYKVLKKGYNESDVERLMDYLQADLSGDQVHKFLLINNITPKRAEELKYIYKQMKIRQVKGGVENGE